MRSGRGSEPKREQDATDKDQLEEQCRYCFDVILSHFFRTALPSPRFPGGHFPLFVTWNKVDSRGNLVLRGCIGNLSGIDLHQGIVKYANASAFDDRRSRQTRSPVYASSHVSSPANAALQYAVSRRTACSFRV